MIKIYKTGQVVVCTYYNNDHNKTYLNNYVINNHNLCKGLWDQVDANSPK